MKALSRARWLEIGLIALAAVAFPHAAMAQVQATLFSSATGPFKPTDPIPISIKLEGGPILTTKGFTNSDLLSLLYFELQGAGTITATNAPHADLIPVSCATPPLLLVPVESPPFPLQQDADDVRKGYDLSQPGAYRVTAKLNIPTFPSIVPCANVPGNLANAAQSTELKVVSNSLDFFVCCFTFAGFFSPVGPAVDPALVCSTAPAVTRKFGDTVPMKFQLSLNNAVVKTAVATISAQRCGGEPLQVDLGQGSVPTNQFKVSGDQYVFNLDTKALGATGTWQINATVSDGSVHSVLIELRE